ncbi:MAG TPA: histidine phosphatase family protein [Geminicoccaceae bacterium]|nr:histidine phosphatase family protein [Geminicoccaceae bacterium]
MRTLLLMRHAKSSWDRPDLADAERPLAARGRKAAPLIARYLKEQRLIPDLVLCSPALRVRETWELMTPVLGGAVACRTLHSLYAAPPSRLVEPLRRVADEVRVLLVIGHNPGLGSLAAGLAGAGPKKALERLRTKFPTGGLVVLTFEIERWAELAAGAGRLADFVRPKDLA